MSDFFTKMVSSVVDTLKKTLCFKGRATKLDFWSFVLFCLLVDIVFVVLEGAASWLSAKIEMSFPSILVIALFVVVAIPLLLCLISLSVRRLHDLSLSGFWLFYLNPTGLPVIFLVYLLDLDPSGNRIVEKIGKVGSPWLGWILTLLFWPLGAGISLLILFLYDGKDEENEFGPSPYQVDERPVPVINLKKETA